MADKLQKFSDNVPGKFYVDEECINCHLCSEIAVDNFKNNEEDEHDFVYKQPTNQDELETCMEAMESCPVEAIGDDGE